MRGPGNLAEEIKSMDDVRLDVLALALAQAALADGQQPDFLIVQVRLDAAVFAKNELADLYQPLVTAFLQDSRLVGFEDEFQVAVEGIQVRFELVLKNPDAGLAILFPVLEQDLVFFLS